MLVVVNTIVLIALCITTYAKNDVGTDYIPSATSEIEPTASTRYLISSKDFTIYDSYNSTISEYDYMYSTYVVDAPNIDIGNEISAGDVLGQHTGNDVIAEYDSLCIDIKSDGDSSEILTYNYNSFGITVNLSTDDYHKVQFGKINYIYVKIDETYYSAKFIGYDYSSYITENIIKANFVTTNCDTLVNHNSICSVEIVKEHYASQICVAASIYNSQEYSKLFYVIEGDTITSIYVSAFAIVDDYALISCTNYNLRKGMYLYAYE